MKKIGCFIREKVNTNDQKYYYIYDYKCRELLQKLT